MTSPAATDAPLLRTASSLVVLTADTYRALVALPVGGGPAAPPPLRDLLSSAVDALEQARTDLAAATREAGGAVQTAPDPKYAAVVDQALPTVRGPGDVVGLALTLEDVLAQTLVRDAVDLSVPAVRATVLGHAAGAAGRKSVLLILQSLLSTGRTELVAAPPDLLALPAGVGGVGVPDVLFPTEKASPAAEGSAG